MFEVPGTTERAALIDVGSTLLELMEWETPPGRAFTATPDDIGVGYLGFAVGHGRSGGEATGRSGGEATPDALEDPDGIEVRVATADRTAVS
jgi:hypothetical protein